MGIAVHPGALRAPENPRPPAACADGAGGLQWVGAVDERMLLPTGARGASLRAAIRERLLVGTRCWQLVRPGLLTAAGVGDPYLTLYAGERPWVVLGELEDGQLLAAPLNGALANPKWFARRSRRGTCSSPVPGPRSSSSRICGRCRRRFRGAAWSTATPTPISAGRCSSTTRRSEAALRSSVAEAAG